VNVNKNVIGASTILIISVISIVILIHPPLVFTLFYTLALFCLITLILDPKRDFFGRNLVVLLVYILLSILIYLIHRTVMPDYYGFSGGLGVGTDDLGFFYNVTDDQKFKPPPGYRVFDHMHSYSMFLQVLFPFRISHPLNLIIPNVLGIAFLPLISYKFANLLTDSRKIAMLAFLLTAICPFIMVNGLILVRDGWVAFFFTLGFYSILSKRYLPLVLSLVLLFFLRLSSGLLLIICALFYLRHLTSNITRGKGVSFINFLGFFFVGLIILVLMFPDIQSYLESKGVENFSREEYIEGFLGRFKNSLFYRIQSLPRFLSIPVSYLFFFFAPFLKFTFYTYGVFNIRTAMLTTIFPILFLFYIKYLFQGIVHAFNKKDKHVRKIVLLTLLLIFMLSHF